MDYYEAQSIKNKIGTALNDWKGGETKCLLCYEKRTTIPSRIELAIVDDEITPILTGEIHVDTGWIEIYTEANEHAKLKGLICGSCATTKGLVEAPKEPEPVAAAPVPASVTKEEEIPF